MNGMNSRELYALLLEIDGEIASKIQNTGCPCCGSQLDSATYPRKLRGFPPHMTEGLSIRRYSYCCRRDGCRRRVTPPSVRFLDRHLYATVVVVLATAIQQGPTRRGVRYLANLIGADRKTVKRWSEWWKNRFPKTLLWEVFGYQFQIPIPPREVPRSLVSRSVGLTFMNKLIRFLKFLATSDGICPRGLQGGQISAEVGQARGHQRNVQQHRYLGSMTAV